MKRTFTLLTIVAVSFAIAAPAFSRGGASLLIRHQTRGCHAWSLNGGAYLASQSLKLTRGATLVIVNNDVMAHKLIKTSGPAVTMVKTGTAMHDMSNEFRGSGVMAHTGAAVKITFNKAGTYTFTTKFGEDYMPVGETKGEDNVLKLKVTVR
jgi:plastocyanin